MQHTLYAAEQEVDPGNPLGSLPCGASTGAIIAGLNILLVCCIAWTHVLLQVGSPGVNQARDYLLEQVTQVQKLAQEREDLETEVRRRCKASHVLPSTAEQA